MFSADMLAELKKAKGYSKDAEILEVLPKSTRSIVSEIKSGKRHLTEEQALFIAHECGLNVQWVLVQLAEETAKTEEAKTVWHDLAKKIRRSATAALLAVIVIFGGLNQNSEPSALGV
ncbi:DUF3693 domain-containing protein [Rheinheimera nanhaiensis]|uniref:Bacteriophage f237 ORF10 n=1 Tax=Rheinheimera nanhaiensis E407-8 TaxID=562729 RepID=I1DYP8_9GAMM|nr:DUF3693 domain-containing protein [Rheinheimera nanhaiensis]GAB59176.1 bacteriophage f237 ORF10 [Rheinheimera nanhaiensis E407-8]